MCKKEERHRCGRKRGMQVVEIHWTASWQQSFTFDVLTKSKSYHRQRAIVRVILHLVHLTNPVESSASHTSESLKLLENGWNAQLLYDNEENVMMPLTPIAIFYSLTCAENLPTGCRSVNRVSHWCLYHDCPVLFPYRRSTCIIGSQQNSLISFHLLSGMGLFSVNHKWKRVGRYDQNLKDE